MSWILQSERGRQIWEYDESKKPTHSLKELEQEWRGDKNKHTSDRVYRYHALEKNFKPMSIPKDVKMPKDKLAAKATESLFKGYNYYKALQMEDGHWPGDYGGPMFLMPGLVFTCYITKTELDQHTKTEMIRYLKNHQNEDGGWGLHIEGPSTMFGAVLSYVTMRILGVKKTDKHATKAHQFIQKHGGATLTPSWGKFWLASLGVFDWDGVNSLVPEMWLLPKWLPFHPSNYWCHCRMVYLPMSYCYGHRVTGEITDLIKEIREEIYTEKYATVQWANYRSECCELDLYNLSGANPLFLKTLFGLVNIYEKYHISYFRKKALDFIADYIDAEDHQTLYVDIGPVNKAVNMLSVWHRYGKDSEQFRKHQDRVRDYLWVSEDGMKMQGYNGSQLWDTSFAAQAYIESGLHPYFKDAMTKAYDYIDISQVDEETPNREKWFRHIAKGAWPFSTKDHGWPISDCTSEGLKAALALDATGLIPEGKQISFERYCDAINVILSFQNKNGGWATYENTRGPAALEYINPSEIFGDIMIDYSYVECSSASMQALLKFRKRFPDHRKQEISSALEKGLKFVKSIQRPDGSWYGSWAVCFTYGGWFGLELLAELGEADSEAAKRGAEFLLSKQRADGGWGESYKACVIHEYVQHPDESQVINTAWALLALMKIKYGPAKSAIRKGVEFLLSKQLDDGDWAQQSISGVFNGNCMISYTNYRNIFPMWALARYKKMNGDV